jgi:hypothetical protein
MSGPGLFGIWTGQLKGIKLKKEEDLSIRSADFLRLSAPADLVFVHVANESIRSKVTWLVLRAMGFVRGWPDMHLLFRGAPFYIEFKVKPNKPDDDQIAVMRRLVEAGGRCAVVYTLEEFIAQVRAWGIVST